ncbi:MAG: hypothetical protein HGA87_00820 [Desulfobulbaceae bacterium]|nr:hypothetical protein [Desulfobulbaceae bacterium]
MNDTAKTYADLRAPLPKEAIKPHPTKAYLSTINPAYVIDRLNMVLGIGKWHICYEIISATEKMVIAKGILSVPEMGISVEQFGGNDNSDKGDAYKGACTDALTKCASYIGVGLHIWMNEKELPPQKPTANGDSKKPSLLTNGQHARITELQQTRNIPAERADKLNKLMAGEVTAELAEKVIRELEALPPKS